MLPQKHLARFVVEVIDGLDLRAMSGSIAVLDRRPIIRACFSHFSLRLCDGGVFEPQAGAGDL